MATNSEGYATKIILLCGPLRIVFFKGINRISPGNIFWRPHVCLVIEWMAERDAVKPLCTFSCMLTACHKQPPIQKSQNLRQILFSRPHHHCWGSLSCEWPLPVGNCWILAWGGYKMKLQEILINKAHFDFLRDAEKLWNNNLHKSSKGS